MKLKAADEEVHGNFVDAVLAVCEECAGYDLRKDYSGRGMFGKSCLGVVVANYREMTEILFRLGALLGEDEELPQTDTDSMGQNIIVYWPFVQVEEWVPAASKPTSPEMLMAAIDALPKSERAAVLKQLEALTKEERKTATLDELEHDNNCHGEPY